MNSRRLLRYEILKLNAFLLFYQQLINDEKTDCTQNPCPTIVICILYSKFFIKKYFIYLFEGLSYLLKGILTVIDPLGASLVAQTVKNLPAVQETWVQSLEKGMATHSSILAWRIPWTEEPGRLQSTGLQRVGQD